jgi:hypothetical protein
MSLSRFFCILPLLLFALNSSAENAATADDVHAKGVAYIHDVFKNLIAVNCKYVPPVSEYEDDGAYKRLCEPYLITRLDTQDPHYVHCMEKERNEWINSYERIINKTIPVWSTCPESVTGLNRSRGRAAAI